MGTHPETTAGRAKRTKAGTAFLIASLPILACGGWLLFTSEGNFGFCSSGAGGLALGALALIWGLHGLTSKPLLRVDENGIAVSGYLIPSSNFLLPWGQIANARLFGEGEAALLQLTAQNQKSHAIERYRYEGFEELLAEVEARLGHPVEKASLTPPAKKG